MRLPLSLPLLAPFLVPAISASAKDPAPPTMREPVACRAPELAASLDSSEEAGSVEAAREALALGCRDPLRRRLKSSDAKVRFRAAWGVMKNRADGFAADMARLLSDRDELVRGTAALYVKRLELQGFEDKAAKLLSDSLPANRATAAAYLGGMRAARYRKELEALRDDPDAGVRDAAAEALASIALGPAPAQRGIAEVIRKALDEGEVGNSGSPALGVPEGSLVRRLPYYIFQTPDRRARSFEVVLDRSTKKPVLLLWDCLEESAAATVNVVFKLSLDGTLEGMRRVRSRRDKAGEPVLESLQEDTLALDSDEAKALFARERAFWLVR